MDIKTALEKYFGYTAFRPGQEEIITAITKGRNVLAILPTGGGKSLCYQIPALIAEKYSIVISPLIALMKDQVDSLNRAGISASYINSSLDYPATEKVLNDLNNGKIGLLYVSPEKLENSFFTERIKNNPPEYLFIDEAHCISEWGHNFRPSYRKIINFIKYTGIQKISAFTATATEEVRNDIVQQLELKNAEIFVKGFERNNIALNVIRTTKKKEKALDLIRKNRTPAIIYASTRENCEDIAYYLNSNGHSAAFYHAGLTTELRKIIQDDFIEGRIDIIAATNAFGMGIDKSNIRLIIHYNMTGSIENYYQEFGRAGRDGEEASVYLLYDKKDESIQNYFIDNSYPLPETVKVVYNTLCDYIKLALRNEYKPPIQIDQNLLSLMAHNGVSRPQLENSIATLEISGYLKRNPEFDKGHFVQILLPRQKLESYMKSFAGDRLRDLLVTLLREGGAKILAGKIRINPAKISEELSSDKREILDLLNELSNLGIIQYDKPSGYPSVTLLGARVKQDDLELDTAKLERLKGHLKSKLNSMIEYVNAEECRFRVILKYFGEDASGYKCGKCDICSDAGAEDRISLEFFQEKILETIHENEGRVRRKVLTDILRGKDDKRDYTVYSNFGCAKHFSKTEIDEAIQYLIARDAVIEIEGMLAVSEKGKNHFASAAPVQKGINEGYEEKLKLFNELRNARKEISVKFSQPVNLICSDEILKKITDIKPKTASALLAIEGFNKRMYNKIGEEFLNIVRNNEEMKRGADADGMDDRFNLKDLIKKRYKLEEIASLLKTPEAVISIRIESLVKFDSTIDISTLFTGNELKQIELKIREGITSLKDLKENLPSSISYAKIRIALAAIKSI